MSFAEPRGDPISPIGGLARALLDDGDMPAPPPCVGGMLKIAPGKSLPPGKVVPGG